MLLLNRATTCTWNPSCHEAGDRQELHWLWVLKDRSFPEGCPHGGRMGDVENEVRVKSGEGA